MVKKSKDIELAKALIDVYTTKNSKWVFDEESEYNDEEEYDEDEDIYDNEFATILMDELTANNLDSHILLKYPQIANWWGDVLNERKRKADAKRKAEAAKRKAEKDKHARDSLLARLTPEERRLLGIK